MKIGVVTFFGSNYGAILQCYALQKILESLGHDVKTINRGWGKYASSPSLKQKIKNLIFPNKFELFKKKYIKFTPLIKNERELLNLNNQFDAIIVGSDQVWNADCIKDMGKFYFLDWVNSSVKKYAYAVSFGKNTFDTTPSKITEISSLIQSYKKISVRENSGLTICQNILKCDAVHVLDPTFLLTSKHYDKLINCTKTKKKYICQYFLDNNEHKNDIVHQIASKLNLSVTNNYPNNINKYKGIFLKKYRYPSIPEWLKNIRDAEFVITDSFHGTVFSLIFQKRFICINNKKRGSARFQSLLGELNLLYRLIEIEDSKFIEKTKTILESPINYETVNRVIIEKRNSSLMFLKTL